MKLLAASLSSGFERLNQLSFGQGAWTVLISAALLRLGMWLSYGPLAYSDTFTYRRLADQILQGWEFYDGTRVPGFPIFMALVGSEARIYLLQLLMGIAITLGFYYIAFRLSGRVWFGVLAGMAHQFNLGQLFFEANLLTETLTTFWIVLTLVGLVHASYHPQARSIGMAFVLGVSTAFAILTRPLFVYMPAWLALWIVLTWQDFDWPAARGRTVWRCMQTWMAWFLQAVWRNLKFLLAYALPVGGLVLGWMNLIHTYYHDWALSTMTGYHLMQHTGAFFEYVPDEYAALRDTYLIYRERRIAESGTQTNAIWEAIPDMQAASGLSFYDLSRVLAKISLQLIQDHPGLFLRSVAEGWWLFWRAPVYWSAQAFHHPAWQTGWLPAGFQAIILLQRGGIFLANLVFILSSFYIPFRWLRSSQRQLSLTGLTWLGLLGMVWCASVVQALLDHGDNPRFLIPLQTIPVLWLLWLLSSKIPALGRHVVENSSSKRAAL